MDSSSLPHAGELQPLIRSASTSSIASGLSSAVPSRSLSASMVVQMIVSPIFTFLGGSMATVGGALLLSGATVSVLGPVLILGGGVALFIGGVGLMINVVRQVKNMGEENALPIRDVTFEEDDSVGSLNASTVDYDVSEGAMEPEAESSVDEQLSPLTIRASTINQFKEMTQELNERYATVDIGFFSMDKVVEAVELKIDGTSYVDYGLRLNPEGYGVVKDIHIGYSEELGPVAISYTKLDDDATFEVIKIYPEIYQVLKEETIGIMPLYSMEIDPVTKKQIVAQKLCNGGDLYNIQSLTEFADKLTLKMKNDIALDLLYGLRKLHSNGLIHGDIKPANVILNWDDNDNPEAFLADFDLTHFKDAHPLDAKEGYNKKKTSNSTLEYRAPEYFFKAPYDAEKGEVWSMGLVLALLFVPGHNVYDDFAFAKISALVAGKDNLPADKNELIDVYEDALDWNALGIEDEKLLAVLKAMIEPDPAKRCTLTEANTLFRAYYDQDQVLVHTE